MTRVSQKPLSEPSRSPAECPFEASVGTSFGNFRRMPRVPKVTPKALRNPLSEPFGACQVSRKPARKPPLRNLLSKPPPFGLSFGKCHVSRVPIHKGPSRKPLSAPRVQRVILPPEASECDTCPEYPSRESSSGCRPSSPRVPSARAERPLPSTFRARHVSPGVFPF